MKKEKLAVIGSGISGISACLFLSKKYEVSLFEKNNYLGGHTRTKKIDTGNTSYDIDTGFIVFNNDNYPELVKLFEYLNIKTENSKMSFSISLNKPNLEYGSKTLKALFAQKKNLFSFEFWCFIYEIFRLYKKCKNLSFDNDLEKYTVEEFLVKNNFSKKIKDLHIYPMLSSIWSCNKSDIKKFPLISFINFFNNHKLFNFIKRPQWKFVHGGGVKYINAIINKKLFKYQKKTFVKKILRENNKIIILLKNNQKYTFDKVVIATHADQALNLLDNPSEEESEILSKFKYSKNLAYLHSDARLMPKFKQVWSSWNFLGNTIFDKSFSLTYWMNSLQKIKNKKNFFVSINPLNLPDNYYDETVFEHPIYNMETLNAQKEIYKIQGNMNTWFCGSYCGYGFHEDGIQSAVYISDLLNGHVPWKRSKKYLNRLQFLKQ